MTAWSRSHAGENDTVPQLTGVGVSAGGEEQMSFALLCHRAFGSAFVGTVVGTKRTSWADQIVSVDWGRPEVAFLGYQDGCC